MANKELKQYFNLNDPFNVKSLDVANWIIPQIVYQNFDTVTDVIGLDQMYEIIADFMNMVVEYPDCNSNILIRNCRVNFKSNYPNVSDKVFNIVINVFIAALYTSIVSYSYIEKLQMEDAHVHLTIDEIESYANTIYNKMEDVLIQNFGLDYDMDDLMYDVIDYSKVIINDN